MARLLLLPACPYGRRNASESGQAVGVNLPFGGVVCAEQVRTIWIETDWRARVRSTRTLVFLEHPGERDLRDIYTAGPGLRFESLAYDSPDAIQVTREKRRDGSVLIYWQPRVHIMPFALYKHQDTWVPPTSHQQAAIFSEYRGEGKTGVVTTEIVTPLTFETAMVFERPRWPMLTSELALVKYAFKHLEETRDPPPIAPDGKRLEWKINGPRRGARYVCVAFHEHGVSEWQEKLKSATLSGRLTALVGRAKRLLPDSRRARRAYSQHPQVLHPRSHVALDLFRHHARDLHEMTQIVRDPGRDQLAQRHVAELRMDASPLQIVIRNPQPSELLETLGA